MYVCMYVCIYIYIYILYLLYNIIIIILFIFIIYIYIVFYFKTKRILTVVGSHVCLVTSVPEHRRSAIASVFCPFLIFYF